MSHSAHRARLNKSEKGLIVATTLFVVLVGGFTWWWDEINRDPVVNIPTPVMPCPNAFDDYVNAANTLVWKTPDRYSENRKYGELPSLDPSYVPPKRVSPPSYTPLTLQEVEAGVKKNRPALAILRQSFHYAYREPPIRSGSQQLPYYEKFRGMATALEAEGYVYALNGQWRDGTNSYLDAMELGVTCCRGGPLISGGVSRTVQLMMRRELWRTVDHLDAAAARAAAKRLERILAKRVPLADTLEEEKWVTQILLLELFQYPRKDWPYDSESTKDELVAIRLRLANKREVMAHHTAYLDALITEAKKPYATRAPVPVPEDAFIRQYFIQYRDYEYTGLKWAVNDTYNHLLLTMLALRAYRQAQGVYPATLGDLCPKYLTRVPDDPFAKSGPLRYTTTGRTYCLYSLGPDGADNGGAPSADGQRKPGGYSGSKPISANSYGDIVAGVNVW